MKKILLILPLLFISLMAKDIAFVKSVKGDVTAGDDAKTLVVKQGDKLHESMLITTGDESSVTIIFQDNSVVVLGSNTLLLLEKYVFAIKEKKYQFELSLSTGTASFESGKISELSPESFIFRTPEATVGIRGTKFMVKVQ